MRLGLKSPKWLALPVLVTAAISTLVAVHHQGGQQTHVLGLSIKPAAAGGNGGGSNGNGNSGSGSNPSKNFIVTGSITGLVPGVQKTVALQLNNPNSQAIRVQSLTVTATGGSACSNSMLLLGSGSTSAIGSMSLDLVVPGHGATSATVAPLDPQFPVSLSAAATNACKNVSWTLTFSGSAVQA